MTTRAATTAAGHVFAATLAQMDAVARQYGPEGVARWARPFGTEQEIAAIADLFRQLQAAQKATAA